MITTDPHVIEREKQEFKNLFVPSSGIRAEAFTLDELVEELCKEIKNLGPDSDKLLVHIEPLCVYPHSERPVAFGMAFMSDKQHSELMGKGHSWEWYKIKSALSQLLMENWGFPENYMKRFKKLAKEAGVIVH